MAPTSEYYFAAILDRHCRTRKQFLRHAESRAIPQGYHLLRDCLLMVDDVGEWYHIDHSEQLPRWSADSYPSVIFDVCRKLYIRDIIVHSVRDDVEFDDFRFYRYSASENDIDVE